jgi:flagellum-specific peptidoglycan hydrolase FlgJ
VRAARHPRARTLHAFTHPACRRYTVDAGFAKYNSPADSFAQHGLFLRRNPRYAAAFSTKTPQEFADAIAAGP